MLTVGRSYSVLPLRSLGSGLRPTANPSAKPMRTVCEIDRCWKGKLVIYLYLLLFCKPLSLWLVDKGTDGGNRSPGTGGRMLIHESLSSASRPVWDPSREAPEARRAHRDGLGGHLDRIFQARRPECAMSAGQLAPALSESPEARRFYAVFRDSISVANSFVVRQPGAQGPLARCKSTRKRR